MLICDSCKQKIGTYTAFYTNGALRICEICFRSFQRFVLEEDNYLKRVRD